MKKKCKNCNEEFDARSENHKFCSVRCSMLYRHKDKTYRNNIVNKLKEYKNSVSGRKRQSEISSEYWKNLKENDNDKFVKRMNALDNAYQIYIANDENRKYLSDKTTEYFKNYDNRKKLSNIRKEYFKNPDHRKKQQEINKEIQNRPEVREKQRSHWKDDEYVNWRFERMHIYKDYTLPSGKIVKVQGYENRALDILLKDHEESDIVVASENIRNFIGNIEYEYNGKHSYTPDIFIKSENKIIEVKSSWTYEITKKQTDAKGNACIASGFTFQLMIL